MCLNFKLFTVHILIRICPVNVIKQTIQTKIVNFVSKPVSMIVLEISMPSYLLSECLRCST